jgi:hypothetical protein
MPTFLVVGLRAEPNKNKEYPGTALAEFGTVEEAEAYKTKKSLEKESDPEFISLKIITKYRI